VSEDRFDFHADYELLGIDPGGGLDAVRQAYRRAVQRVHPDRAHADDPGGAAMVAINLAYGRLCAFHREYGRLPMEPHATMGAAVAPRAAPPPRHANRARAGVLAAFLMLAGVGTAWLLAAGSSGEVATDAVGAPPREAVPLAMPAVVPGNPPDALDGIRLGDSAARVHRVLGAPILADRELWEYGPSHVRFERGRVVGWYSSPMKPLKIAGEPAPPADDPSAR
jgi:hypothetical protein